MKRLVLSVLVIGLASAAFAAGARAGDMHKPAHAGKTMAQYLVIAPHTEAECLATLDHVSAMGDAKLAKWDFGCADGDHTGYCIVTASNRDEALMQVPEDIRGKAHAVMLHKFTAAELKSIHAKMHS